MKVLVAGASGVVGRQLVPLLLSRGFDVAALARRPVHGGDVEVLAVDALDRDDLVAAVRRAAPDAVVHAMTAIPHDLQPRRLARQMAETNRLRTEGTANLIAAADGAHFVALGLAYAYAPEGGSVATEDRAMWHDGPKPFRPVVRALAELERLTEQVGGGVLRVGHLYGPGTIYAADGSFTTQVQRRRVPVVGGGNATFSFVHTQDVAAAILAAIERTLHEPVNVVDDEPIALRDWLPMLAATIGAPPPKHVPRAVGRLATGRWGVAFMDEIVGADNGRARELLGWTPHHPSPRVGFPAELKPATASPTSTPPPEH